MSSSIFIDQLGRSVSVPNTPKRIISLVPSITELLFDLDLGNETAGVTRFCIHPTSAKEQKTIVGGTKKFDFAKIDQMKPDLIIGNKEENYREGITQLAEKYPVWMSDVNSYEEALVLILQLGIITKREEIAKKWISEIEKEFSNAPFFSNQRVLYFIWREPWMAAGQGTFIDAMLNKIGLANVLVQSRYPEHTLDEVKRLDPDVVLLSSEPFPFNETHQKEFQALLPAANVMLVDGEMFSWYGSRLVQAARYFRQLHF